MKVKIKNNKIVIGNKKLTLTEADKLSYDLLACVGKLSRKQHEKSNT